MPDWPDAPRRRARGPQHLRQSPCLRAFRLSINVGEANAKRQSLCARDLSPEFASRESCCLVRVCSGLPLLTPAQKRLRSPKELSTGVASLQMLYNIAGQALVAWCGILSRSGCWCGADGGADGRGGCLPFTAQHRSSCLQTAPGEFPRNGCPGQVYTDFKKVAHFGHNSRRVL